MFRSTHVKTKEPAVHQDPTMADVYSDFPTGLVSMYKAWPEPGDTFENQPEHGDDRDTKKRHSFQCTLSDVRRTVSVVGLHRESIMMIKKQLYELEENPFSIESFHVHKRADILDGAFLVPKIVLVAPHIPGRKLIDDVGDEGQLDWLYDEAVETGVDLVIIYVKLPRAIYPPMRHILYHPKLADNLFPEQPILKEMAGDNCFLTVTEGNQLNKLQGNLLREWINKPVGDNHPVYKTVEQMSSLELSLSDLAPSVSDVTAQTITRTSSGFDNREQHQSEELFVPATEEHPLADKMKKKKFKFKLRKEKSDTDKKKSRGSSSGVEMNVYRNTKMAFDTENSAL